MRTSLFILFQRNQVDVLDGVNYLLRKGRFLIKKVVIKSAQTHNLKKINLEIPKNQIVVFTGVSGSGKSSLVFDTIYTEAQRQLIETFSSFARRRLPKLSRPPVEEIRNISTAIVIDQKRMGRNLRSTVGTATEILTYLRMLFSRCGDPFIGPSFLFSFNHPEGMCPECKGLGKRITVDSCLLLDMEKNLREGAITHPDFKIGGWNWRELVGSELFDNDLPLKDFPPEEIDKLLYAEDIPIVKKHGAGIYSKKFEGIARKLERLYIDKAEDELPEVRKDAYQSYFIYSDCNVCHGTRLNERACSVRVNGKTMRELVHEELTLVDEFLKQITDPVAQPLVTKMRRIIGHMIDIGVGYLSLNRAVSTLSGGESQRVKMARQLDCDLVDMMYILDEPSIGLHPKDNVKLIEILRKLRNQGNSVFVVEHDPDIISSADWIVDVGPYAGTKGGEIVFTGSFEELKKTNTVTAQYLKEDKNPLRKRKIWDDYIEVKNAQVHNLKNISVRIPQGVLTCVTGVAGSGKSSLIHEVFLKENRGAIVVDQTAPARSSRSNPATYIGFFDLMRKEIAQATNSDPSLFSFNSKGACPKCKGMGYLAVEMSFMDDVKMTCDECKGQRYNDEVLAIRYKDKNMFEILEMTVDEARNFFENKEVKKRMNILCDVGLDYLTVGQPMSTLSGGESQRIKLASELHKSGNIYVMDEPTTGLHMADIVRFMGIIKRLVDKNNTVIIIEHNLDVIKQADWIIDMGPEGGSKGGEIIFEGTPEDIIKCENSYTGQFLKEVLT
ncbi:MAG: ATP-binding cassette domain-containing protein [Chitinophagales bacterium]